MTSMILATVGTKKALWSITGLSFVALVLTPELTVAFGALLAIIFTGIVNIMNARAAAVKLEQIHVQAAETAVKVDGAAHASVAKIELLQQQIAMLVADKAEKKETADLLATDVRAKQELVAFKVDGTIGAAAERIELLQRENKRLVAEKADTAAKITEG